MADAGRILDMIHSPQDLHVLSLDELNILCSEIREQIVATTSKNGGHVASSLGAVEIIVALHSLLNEPEDKIVFDVGHQAYAHKLLTGRLGRFDTLRQIDGITGFPNPDESSYDVHPSGHASDSLSVAMGLAKARDLSGGKNKIVAVIGDSSLAGGMAFEALNHIGQEQTRMVIVLNDNGMSISRPVGALVRHLGYIRATSKYRDTRDAVQDAMETHGGAVSQGLLDFGRNMKESMKQFVIPHSMIFEQLGIVCTPPVDGHNLADLRDVFHRVLNSEGPVLVHVVTKKGAGYKPAQDNPEMFHGVGPFDIKTGKVLNKPSQAPTYTAVLGRALVEEAKHNPDIVALTAAMKTGTGLDEFSQKFPKRFIDTGITEEHCVGLASGLAAGGKLPVVAMYSTFLQRAIDQTIIDNALAHRHTVFCIDRAGLVGADGPTHNGMFDIAYMRMIPNMRVMTPSNEAELVNMLHTALALKDGPVSLRYPRGTGEGADLPAWPPQVLPVGRGVVRREGDDVAILGFGRMVNVALRAAELLEEKGISARVVDMRWAKPIDEEAVRRARDTKLVVTAEEGVLSGGAGEGVLDTMAALGLEAPTLCIGLPDKFIEQGDLKIMFHRLGIDAQGIADRIEERLAQR